MSKVITDAQPASSTGNENPEDGFAEYRESQRASKSSVQTETPAEHAPAPERVEGAEPAEKADPAEPKQEAKPLTDEEKSARKRANDERRWTKLNRELGAAKAERDRLAQELAAKSGDSATPKAGTKATDDDPEPQESEFTDFGKYVQAQARWAARQEHKALRAKEAETTQRQTASKKAETFVGRINEYAKAHPGFRQSDEDDEPGSFEIVRDALEDDAREVSEEIATHERAAEIIDYLGKHPELLAQITALKGNPRRALIEYGRIIAEFDKPPASEEPLKPGKVLPKPPATVTGKGHAPTGEQRLTEMAEGAELPHNWRDTFRDRERRKV